MADKFRGTDGRIWDKQRSDGETRKLASEELPDRGGGSKPAKDTAPVGSQGAPDSDPKTRRMGVQAVGKSTVPGSETDPVVGWLVVVGGHGRGKSLALGNGNNAIGRASTSRVPLDFGDNEIHREGHAIITFDPRSRKFYLQPGTGSSTTNLTYLDGNVVLQPSEIRTGQEIMLGGTRLRFVALCGTEFAWD
jgi:hypothetical protein